MANAAEFKAGDRAVAKVGRNLVEVRVKAKADAGWTVVTRTGKTMTVKALERQPGDAAGAKAAPAKAAKAPAAKTAKAAPAPSERAVPKKGLSLLNAAAAVLERSDEPMSVGAMIEKAKETGLWTPGSGKTPAQTLYSAIVREIKEKESASRFRKDGRGRFSFVG